MSIDAFRRLRSKPLPKVYLTVATNSDYAGDFRPAKTKRKRRRGERAKKIVLFCARDVRKLRNRETGAIDSKDSCFVCNSGVLPIPTRASILFVQLLPGLHTAFETHIFLGALRYPI